jgi:hypothetical protein
LPQDVEHDGKQREEPSRFHRSRPARHVLHVTAGSTNIDVEQRDTISVAQLMTS